MKHLTTRFLIAAAVAVLIAIPLDAQTRGGSNSRGGNARSSQGASTSRPESTATQQSGPARNSQSGRQAGRGGSNVRRQSGSTARPQAQAPQTQNAQKPQTQNQRPPQQKQQGTQSRPPQQPGQPGQPGGNTVRQRPPQQPGQRNRPAPRRDDRHGPGPAQAHPGPGHHAERIPPRRRDPMPPGHAIRFGAGGRHYFGYRVSHLPRGYVRRVYRGITYYVLDGIYYRRYNGHYYVCRPPFGVFFDPVAEHLAYSACRFAYYYSVYNTYRTIDENARIITSQNETIAANNARIARQNAEIELNAGRAARSYQEADRLGLVQSYADAGTEYFYDDGVFFVKDAAGQYKTIVPPAGAMVESLPDDYETVTLDGTEYYKVDDTVFRLTVADGTPYFEVLGQMSGALAEKYNPYNSL